MTLDEAREVVEALGIQVRRTIDGDRHGEPVAWSATRARSLLVSLLLRGAETPYPPTVHRIIDTAREWWHLLGAHVGDGPRVERVLRDRLWVGPSLTTAAELASAHQADVDAARLDAEADEMMRGLLLSYRDNPRPLIGLMRDLLGSALPELAS